MPQRILNEDWEDYDNRKIRDSRDSVNEEDVLLKILMEK